MIRSADRDSSLLGVVHPHLAGWDINTTLLSAILFTSQIANWQRGGGKGDKPKPLTPEPLADKSSSEVSAEDKQSEQAGDIPTLEESGTYRVAVRSSSDIAKEMGWA